jgi:hypothetical protein
MIDLMDKNGRIIRLRCEFFGSEQSYSQGHLTADELVQQLLSFAPANEFIRGPYITIPGGGKPASGQ